MQSRLIKELQSVTSCEAGWIAFLCTQEVGPKSLRRTQWGYRWTVYLSQSSSCSGNESLETATLLQPVCFRWLCEKRRRGVWDCVSVLMLKPRGVGGLMNRKRGLLLCFPHCWSFPSCFACPLTELFMALGLVPDLSHTCQQEHVVCFFCKFSTITIFLLLTVPHKTAC